ncbi:short-chain dehydrogenase/reductase [Cadophora sp. MPI-SDFR-AT-0126]|nr:short-chain dehydrogenase/reductase [Leotiomycetes sp. MPI-SDFR-AT-0126]
MTFTGVSLEDVIAHNRSLKTGPKGLVGVFVGGTSGIGEWTFRAFIKHTTSPRAYLIGRNKAVAEKIVSEAQLSNPEAKIDFIPADCSLLREVSRVCDEIKRKEEEVSGAGNGKVNLLVLSQSSSGLGGRSETSEGIDAKFSLIYHSRLLFTHLLTPLLLNAHTAGLPSRTLSILLTGRETALDLSNLVLKEKYSTSTCLAYATTMTTLAFHELARRNAEKGIVGGMEYVHVNPGIVKTGVMRYLPWYMRAVSHVGYAVLTPWRTDVEESGERCLEMGFSERYGSEAIEGGQYVDGVDGMRGAYTVFKTGESTGTKDVVKKMIGEGAGKVIWEYTLDAFTKVETDGKV